MTRWFLAAIFLVLFVPDAAPQSYSELAPQGYILFKRTRVIGVFEGCDKNLDIPFEGGTTFTCLETNHHMAYQPPVIIMKNGQTNTYAVLIDGRAYKGRIPELGGMKLARPLTADDVQGGPSKPILGADAVPLPGVPVEPATPDSVKALTLSPTIPLAPGTQSTTPDPLLKVNQNFPQ